jgi:sugar fermentation stimulation protein A
LGELLVPGRRVVLLGRSGGNRKTAYDLSAVLLDGVWVSLDARLPNDLVAEALLEGEIEPLAGYPKMQREVAFGGSRLDFLLEANDKPLFLIEVKSVTLVEGGWACFPDAVTLRGRRHLLELASAVELGYRAAVVFVVQREDAQGFRPHDESDPDFGRALRAVTRQGVEVYAYACRIAPGYAKIAHPLPVSLEPTCAAQVM